MWRLAALVVVFASVGCSSSNYHPLAEKNLRKRIGKPVATDSAVKVTFLGTSTLLIQDGKTTLLVDGFLSRPGRWQTVLGAVGPSKKIMEKVVLKELRAAGVRKLDAVLVGHAHHDHALDSTAIADHYNARAIGSASFGQIYAGSHVKGNGSSFDLIREDGDTVRVGDFAVHFVPAAHVAPDSFIQQLIDGPIKRPLKTPAHVLRFKCGDVFALHIQHLRGEKVAESIAVTTTASALPRHLKGRKTNVLFLSVGYLSEEPEKRQHEYWDNTVTATKPDVIVPVHWDDFTEKLSSPLTPASGILGDTQAAMEFVVREAGKRPVRVLDAHESIWVSGGAVYCPEGRLHPATQ